MPEEQHSIAIIGGATAGAEAADIFAKQGILTVVFEQNPRPYGKIEDGLPKWHVKLRAKEYETIDRKLGQPHVHLVPNTRVGADVDLRELADQWGFQAVVLANGAWNDRPLPIEGADRDTLIAGIRARGHRDVRAIEGPDDLAPLVADLARPGDLVLCLGAGSITQWANALPGRLAALEKGAGEA